MNIDVTDEADVRTVVSEFSKIWNRHDMAAMRELFSEDSELVNVVGMHWRGQAAVSKGLVFFHRTTFAKTDCDAVDLVIRAIAPDVAIVVATLKMGPYNEPTGREIRDGKGRGSFIVVKRAGEWKIAHFHNTPILLEAQRFDPVNRTDTSPG